MGFETMASALALQCSNQLSYEDPSVYYSISIGNTMYRSDNTE